MSKPTDAEIIAWARHTAETVDAADLTESARFLRRLADLAEKATEPGSVNLLVERGRK